MSESLDIETASDYIETPPGHIETPPESIMGGTSPNYRVTPTTRRVCTKRSPHLKASVTRSFFLCNLGRKNTKCKLQNIFVRVALPNSVVNIVLQVAAKVNPISTFATNFLNLMCINYV